MIGRKKQKVNEADTNKENEGALDANSTEVVENEVSEDEKSEAVESKSDKDTYIDDDDMWYNMDQEDIEEADDTEFDNDCFYIQDGVYVDVTNKVAYVEKDVIKYIVKGNSRYYEYATGEVDRHGNKVIKKLKIKRYKRREKKKFDIGIFREESFGVLLPFINDDAVTDINWNGSQLWIDDVNKGRYKVDIKLDDKFIDIMSIRIANVVSGSFNKYQPYIEAETDELRITILHESISNTGRVISIRKTPAIKRITFAETIKRGDYCSEEIANFMSNSVKAGMNIIVCGLPGAGKTEFVKYLTNYIFPSDRAITIEDTLEIHYDKINPGKDCVVVKVTPQFSYTQAIKESLRLLPKWVLLSEARSTEVKYLIESVSTGTKCMTTLHADDVRKIPDRVVNMVGDMNQAELVRNSVHSFFDLGILIDKDVDPKTGAMRRHIAQICIFTSENGENKITMVADGGELTGERLPDEIMKRFRVAGIIDPFEYTFIKRD